MSKLLKSVVIIFILIISSMIFLPIANADMAPYSYDDPRYALNYFIYSLCDKNGFANVYDYIDTSNTELKKNVEEYLYAIDIDYEIKNTKQLENGNYMISTKIEAEGESWSINGISVDFELKQTDSGYVVVNTNLFDKVGTENVFKFVFKIFAIIGGVIFAFAAIIAIVVIIIVKNVKKKK